MSTGILARTMAATDANDMIYQLDASRNYDPSPHLDRITAPVMWINSADDYHQSAGAGHCGKDGGADASCALRADPHLRRDARPRHAHGGCGVGEIFDRADAGIGAETLMERPGRFPAARICPHSAPILEVHASSRAEGFPKLKYWVGIEGLFTRFFAWLARRMPNERQRLAGHHHRGRRSMRPGPRSPST